MAERGVEGWGRGLRRVRGVAGKWENVARWLVIKSIRTFYSAFFLILACTSVYKILFSSSSSSSLSSVRRANGEIVLVRCVSRSRWLYSFFSSSVSRFLLPPLPPHPCVFFLLVHIPLRVAHIRKTFVHFFLPVYVDMHTTVRCATGIQYTYNLLFFSSNCVNVKNTHVESVAAATAATTFAASLTPTWRLHLPQGGYFKTMYNIIIITECSRRWRHCGRVVGGVFFMDWRRIWMASI